ncbi:hypothetical protein BCIN_11g06550 [Botrytis cinerea B05.10]|uniref:Uncharacterized protein n=1 Tax=Botryotinia fuckeliana (strain B05.10) TaxID=332648 RepID=A0A384JXU7_BOTFB|nr:hypothetical protein BCIN_11g06550 [Botrytis cinerea B05.10]ATZ55400.1 hypothetical protein BCIN_11g06550 [Botrytis cinerea B05.10]
MAACFMLPGNWRSVKEMIMLLLEESGADVVITKEMMKSASTSRQEIILKVLEHHFNIAIPKEKQLIAEFYNAAKSGNNDKIRSLLVKKVKPDAQSPNSYTPVIRNIGSTKVKALISCGAEVVQTDLDSLDILSLVFEDVYAIFVISDFWGLYDSPTNQGKVVKGQSFNVWAVNYEIEQLKQIIDATIRIPTLKHFILSSLFNTTK